MAGISPGMYPGSYPSSEQNPYPSIAMENSASAFYGSLVSRDQCLALGWMLQDEHQASMFAFIAPPVWAGCLSLICSLNLYSQ